MNRFILFCITFLYSGFLLASSKELVLEGVYTGKNLFVQNPASRGEGGFCAMQVIVNEKLVMPEVKSSAFEIDLSQFNINQPLTIRIIHKEDCTPRVLNAYVVVQEQLFSFLSFSVEPGVIEWTTQGEDLQTIYFVERFENNNWIAITPPIKATGPASSASYILKTNHNQGLNRYRVKSLNDKGQVLYSEMRNYEATEPSVMVITE